MASPSASPIQNNADSTLADCEVIEAPISTANAPPTAPVEEMDTSAPTTPDEEMDTSGSTASAPRKRTIRALRELGLSERRPKRSTPLVDNIPEGNKNTTWMQQRDAVKRFAHLLASSVDGKPDLTMFNTFKDRMAKMHENMQKALDTSKEYGTIDALQSHLEDEKKKSAVLAEKLSESFEKFKILEEKYKDACPSLSRPADELEQMREAGRAKARDATKRAEELSKYVYAVVPVEQNGEIIAVSQRRLRDLSVPEPIFEQVEPPSVPQILQQQVRQMSPPFTPRNPQQGLQQPPNSMQVAIPPSCGVVPPHRRSQQENRARLEQKRQSLLVEQQNRQRALMMQNFEAARQRDQQRQQLPDRQQLAMRNQQKVEAARIQQQHYVSDRQQVLMRNQGVVEASRIQQRQHIRQRQQPQLKMDAGDIAIVHVAQNVNMNGPRIELMQNTQMSRMHQRQQIRPRQPPQQKLDDDIEIVHVARNVDVSGPRIELIQNTRMSQNQPRQHVRQQQPPKLKMEEGDIAIVEAPQNAENADSPRVEMLRNLGIARMNQRQPPQLKVEGECIEVVNVAPTADQQQGLTVYGAAMNAGRKTGHLIELQRTLDGCCTIHDASKKDVEGVVREILLHIPHIEFELLTVFDVHKTVRIPGFFESSQRGNVQLTVRTKFEDFYASFMICGNIAYDKLDDVQNKEIQLFVEVSSMKKKALAGNLPSGERCRWGSSGFHECNPQGNRMKFKIKYHQAQLVARKDRVSIFAVITDRISKRMEVSNVGELQFKEAP